MPRVTKLRKKNRLGEFEADIPIGTSSIYVRVGEDDTETDLETALLAIGDTISDLAHGGLQQLGSEDVGSPINPFYLEGGFPIATTADIGDKGHPIKMEEGDLKKCSEVAALEIDSTDGIRFYPTDDPNVYIDFRLTGSEGNFNLSFVYTTDDGETKTIYDLMQGDGSFLPTVAQFGDDNPTIGSAINPVYINNGSIVACNVGSSGAWFNTVPQVRSDGVMEIGRYIDMHYSDTETSDYTSRIACDSTSLIITGTSVSGRIVLNSSTGAATGSATQPVYVNSSGVATACNTTVGASNRPIWSNAGVLTACTASYGSSTTPIYISNGTFTACSAMVPLAGGVTMTGGLIGPTSTDYTRRFRNIRFTTSVPSSLENGDICMVYDA